MTERKQKIKAIFDKLVETNGNALRRLAESDKTVTKAERLTRIKEAPLKLINEGLGEMDIITECVVDYRDYLWLIGQVEKAEVLEANLTGTTEVLDETIVSLERMAKQNDKMREVLEFYADEDSHLLVDGENTTVSIDSGKAARKALGGYLFDN